MPAQISLLIDSPLREMLIRLRAVDTETKKQIGIATKKDAMPIWGESLRSFTGNTLQHAVLVKSGRVGVTARNIQLKSAQVGKLKTGTPVSVLASPAEFGMYENALISTHSPKGTAFKRRVGTTFGARNKAGKVVHPAADLAIPRVASLWIQTAARTLYDAFDLKG
jgi:hypothetical protein